MSQDAFQIIILSLHILPSSPQQEKKKKKKEKKKINEILKPLEVRGEKSLLIALTLMALEVKYINEM